MAHNKFLPRVLAAAAAMMLLAGCGSKADPGFSPSNPVNITIWTYYNGEQLEAFNALVDEFNSTVGKEQGITVESSSHGSVTDLENNVLASAEGKVGAEAMPNIFSAYADTAYALDEMGQIADLSDYLSEEDRAAFIEDYLSEGDFSGSGSIKIFPVAKSAELLFLNETDWEPFAAATGATYDDLATIEGLVSVAEHYYEWTDAQTPDIPNDGRAFFGRDAMANYMLIGAKQLGHAALLMFDLDNLKQINDTFGHDWGDEYIRLTGECFAKNAPARTVCARISGDEFNALFYGYNDQDTLRADICALKAALEQSVVQLPSGRELRVSVSGGVAWYPESSTNLITLRKYADFAMYQVKHSRKGELLEFDPEVYRTDLQERRCHEEFRRLINEELVTYHFQPIIDAKDGSVFAYEALMRVDLPMLHSPADVLRLAREENCLHEVERITFFRASSAYQTLENAGKVVPSALLFVNSIASQYLTPDELSEYSARYASILPRIVIEITEEEVLDPKALRIKQTIRGSSGAFALDDYGSGYSNERSLLELSPNYIKIDLSIIRDIDTDANKRQIVSNTVSYAHQRGMKVVAEGLETADEVRTVLSLGVDLLQGFFLAMPQVEPGGASEESLAVIAEMYSQSDESQISIFGGDKQ